MCQYQRTIVDTCHSTNDDLASFLICNLLAHSGDYCSLLYCVLALGGSMPSPRPLLSIIYTGHATRRHCFVGGAQTQRTLKTMTRHSQPHTERSVYQVCALSPAKPIISVCCHFYSKQNGIHGLIPSGLIGRVTCLYSTGLGRPQSGTVSSFSAMMH